MLHIPDFNQEQGTQIEGQFEAAQCNFAQTGEVTALIFLPQRPRGELHQRRHFPTRSREIPQDFLAAHFLLAERNRGHEALHLEVIDEGM